MIRAIVHLEIKSGLACGALRNQDTEVTTYHQAVTCPKCLTYEKLHDVESNEHRSICRSCRIEWKTRP